MTALLVSAWRGGTPRRLSKSLGIQYAHMDRLTRPLLRKTDLVVNWGVARVFDSGHQVLNFPSRVSRASNKLSCLRALTSAEVSTLDFSTSIEDARKWIKDSSVIGHFDLHAHSGQGLRLFKKGTDLEASQLYTKYFPKDVESRVLLVRRPGGDAEYSSMYMEKVRITKDKYEERGITDSPTTYIRTWDNGWNFARQVEVDSHAVELAKKAARVMQLDYAAVDIMAQTKSRKYVVGEINTAPGLEGMSLGWFSDNLKKLMSSAEFR